MVTEFVTVPCNQAVSWKIKFSVLSKLLVLPLVLMGICHVLTWQQNKIQQSCHFSFFFFFFHQWHVSSTRQQQVDWTTVYHRCHLDVGSQSWISSVRRFPCFTCDRKSWPPSTATRWRLLLGRLVLVKPHRWLLLCCCLCHYETGCTHCWEEWLFENYWDQKLSLFKEVTFVASASCCCKPVQVTADQRLMMIMIIVRRMQ